MDTVHTAQECWDRLVDAGLLRPKDYDKDLVEAIRSDLGLPTVADMRTSLAMLPAQDLIDSLFSALEPLAVMLADLLRLYERIHATHSSDPNLRIRFNFDSGSSALDIDLTEFREWEVTVRQVLATRRFWAWNQNAAWNLVTVTERGFVDPATPPDREGRQPLGWAFQGDPAPRSGIDELDRSIARGWQMRAAFLDEVTSRWPERDNSRVGFHAPDGTVEDSRIMVSDFWDHALSDALTQLAHRGAAAAAASRASTDLASIVSALTSDLNAALDAMPSREKQTETNIEELISLLSLPMWGRRHEFYSAWIFAELVEAIGVHRVAFMVRSGRFSFDFGGTHLATFDSVDGPIHVWAELRTPYATPAGRGRTGAIQPDYRLVKEPIDLGDSTILAVEVKQYLRSALKNPADALADYTGGLQKAHVVLAAYGPVSPRVLEGLTPDARARTDVVRNLHPGRGPEIASFRAIVAAHVPLARPDLTQDGATIERCGDVRLELTWDVLAVDLDLHAVLPDAREVSFRNLTEATSTGRVALEADILRGPGPEVLTISGTDIVAVEVHAYSGEDIAHVGARIRIVSGLVDTTIQLGPHLPIGRRCRVLVIGPGGVELGDGFSSRIADPS